jgi:DNA-binding response OmpR family regulator
MIERRLSIVLVEDDEDSREMLQLFLQHRGHEVFAVASGVEGLWAIVHRRPHMALVDISLPELSGLDVARGVRADGAGGSVYLVALTGFGRGDDRSSVMDAGFDEYILKPIPPGKLDRLLDRAVRLGAVTRRRAAPRLRTD